MEILNPLHTFNKGKNINIPGIMDFYLLIPICIQNHNFECEYYTGSDLRIEQGDDEIGEEAY